MRNNTGIFNSQSYTNEYMRDLRRAVPLAREVPSHVVQIERLKEIIRNAVSWRTYCYLHGKLDSARTTAIMIGRKRRELRALLAQ